MGFEALGLKFANEEWDFEKLELGNGIWKKIGWEMGFIPPSGHSGYGFV